MDTPERIWQLMAKALNSEASSEEKEELFLLLQQNPSLQQQYELLTRIWNEKHLDPENEEDARQHISKIIYRAETEIIGEELMTPRKRRRKRLAIASALALFMILVFGWFFLRSAAGDANMEVLVAKNGSRTRSLLPDGTTVWLNAGSQLSVTSDFSGATREVRLEGEAFFDVIKKAGQPFIVHTSGIDIRVLGTAFNVKSYPEDQSVETTLYRGLVEVSRAGESKPPIELKPNEKLVLSKKAASDAQILSDKSSSPIIKALPRFTITQIDSTKKEEERIETAWVYSRLEFRGDNFEELAQKLQRWYNVTIRFSDEKVKQLRFNGSFEKETVEEAFAALQTANSFTYQINKYEISVGSSK